VVVCDCNSDPLNGSTKDTDPIPTPHWAAYRLLTGAGGLHDEWQRWSTTDPGFTSGFNELVNDPTAARPRGGGAAAAAVTVQVLHLFVA
jgi:hypothetical protein